MEIFMIWCVIVPGVIASAATIAGVILVLAAWLNRRENGEY